MKRAAILLAIVSALGSRLAIAQAIFPTSGDVALTPLPSDFDINLRGPDKNGYVYRAGELNDSCWHPADKTGTFRYTAGALSGGMILPLVIADRAGAVQPFYNPSGERYEYYEWDCALAQALVPPAQYSPVLLGFVADPDTALFRAHRNFLLPDGRPCAVTLAADNGQYSINWRGAIRCPIFDPVNPATVPATFDVLADGTKLDALLGLQPYQDLVPGPVAPFPHMLGYPPSPVDEGWQFMSWVINAEGRLFVVARRRTIHYKGQSFVYPTWLFELKPADHSITVVVGPNNPELHGEHSDLIGQLATDSRAPSLLFSYVAGQEYANYQVGLPGGGETDYGPGGYGFVVIDVVNGGVGYLSVSDVLARIWSNSSFGFGVSQLPDGTLGATATPNRYQLQFNPATFDLDSDGLTAAEEAMIGTSDYRSDSDNGTVYDTWEVRVAGTNPTLAADDALGPEAYLDRVGYSTSPLVRKKMAIEAQSERVPSMSADSPLCTSKTCYDVRGNVIATPNLPATATLPRISADANYLAWRDGNTLQKLTFATGVTEVIADSTELVRHLGVAVNSRDSIHPIDATLLYYVQAGEHPRIVEFRAGQMSKIAFDWDQAGCDSKLGACSATPIVATLLKAEALLPTPYPMAYERETGRFLVGVKSSWRQFVIALRPDHAPELLVVGKSDPYIVKKAMIPTGHGDYYTDVDWVAPNLTYRSVGGIFNSFDNLTAVTTWGNTLLVQSDEGLGAYELVRYDPQVAPGEVLMLYGSHHGSASDVGAGLSRHNLRGGSYNAWYRFPADYSYATTGLDVTTTLRLCAVDNLAGRVREYVPLSPGTVPQLEVTNEELRGARDCLYGKDGTLWILIARPGKVDPALKKRLPGTTAFVLDTSVTLPPLPERFIKKQDGTFEILGHEDPAAGKLYTRSGHVVTLQHGTYDLLWDGAKLVELAVGGDHGYLGGAAIVERPDGLIVVAFTDYDEVIAAKYESAPVLVDPRDRTVTKLGLTFATAATVVPGGQSIDPWSGDPVALAQPTGLPGGGPGNVTVPTAPQGGTPRATPSSGCAVGGASAGDGAVWLLVATLMARRARRATPDRRRATSR